MQIYIPLFDIWKRLFFSNFLKTLPFISTNCNFKYQQLVSLHIWNWYSIYTFFIKKSQSSLYTFCVLGHLGYVSEVSLHSININSHGTITLNCHLFIIQILNNYICLKYTFNLLHLLTLLDIMIVSSDLLWELKATLRVVACTIIRMACKTEDNNVKVNDIWKVHFCVIKKYQYYHKCKKIFCFTCPGLHQGFLLKEELFERRERLLSFSVAST